MLRPQAQHFADFKGGVGGVAPHNCGGFGGRQPPKSGGVWGGGSPPTKKMFKIRFLNPKP